MRVNSSSAACDLQYRVIPLSIQKDDDTYVVGNADLGDFYQFPEQGLAILTMLQSGETPAVIKSRMAAIDPEPVDVDDFIIQLAQIGFIHRGSQLEMGQKPAAPAGRAFAADQRLARAVFSPAVLAIFLAIVLYAVVAAVKDPALRLNPDALYIETNRTLLLVIVLALSMLQTVAHEIGHMLAAAKEGIKCRYGIGTRLWTIVAESDLTGVLSLPKAKRYLPMLAGLLVDATCLALLTILLEILLRVEVGPFAVQVIQVMALETAIAMAWQFNVFVKTDIYFVLCNYFSYSDLDRDARVYLRHVLHRASFGRLGAAAPGRIFDHVAVLRLFSLVWVFGRLLSMFLLLSVFLPAMWRYLDSAARMLNGPPASVWVALDTIAYVTILLSMLGAGMYLWLKPQWKDGGLP